jgi:hemolysin III
MNKTKNRVSATSIIEEVLNSVTHGIGAIAGILGMLLGLVLMVTPNGLKIGFIIYVTCLILLMLASTLYHALAFTKAKRVFQAIDHSGIYLLIAGTFTPFIVYLYQGWQKITLLVMVWIIAVTGIAITTTILLPRKIIWGEVIFYVCFGWMGLVLLPKIHLVDPIVIWLLIAGGILYTLGILPFALKKSFAHFSWHLFVIGAATAHFFAIINLV